MTIDRTDKRILALLQKNARMSFAAIGRDIGLSRTAVQDRVTKLEAAGAIKGYHAEVSAGQTRLVHAVVFIKIAVRPCDEALDWLFSLEGVHDVQSLSGEIDAIARCVVATANDLTKLNDTIGTSDLIESSRLSFVLDQRK